MNRNSAAVAYVFFTLTLATMLSGCHDELTPENNKNPSPPIASSSDGETVLPTPGKPGKGVIYVVSKVATSSDDLTSQTVTLTDSQTPAKDAVNALISSPNSPLPSGIALRGISMHEGITTLDFSQSPVEETHGEGGQSRALTALSRTLGQFPNIKQMQIMVQGKVVTNFGEFSSDGPIDVIRPEAVSGTKIH